MKKVFFIGLLCLSAFNSTAISQYRPEQEIDSLRKVLPLLKDRVGIDGLKTLCDFYILAEQRDSAKRYAVLACEEAKKLNYIHGIAVSLANQAHIVKHFDDDFIQTEKYAKESLQWFERTANKAGVDTAWYYLQDTRLAQSEFDEVIDFGKKDYAAWLELQCYCSVSFLPFHSRDSSS